MTYLEAKTKVLRLMNEYSNNGAIISNAKNADYINRFPDLFNDSLKEVAEKEKLEANAVLTLVSSSDNYNKYSLPNDYKQIKQLIIDEEPFFNYSIREGFLFLPLDFINPEMIYEKNPLEINDNTIDNYTFEVRNANILAYYVASVVIASQDSDASVRLMAEYIRRLNNIKPLKTSNKRVKYVGW